MMYIEKKCPGAFAPGIFNTKSENQFPSTVIWLIADITPPATIM